MKGIVGLRWMTRAVCAERLTYDLGGAGGVVPPGLLGARNLASIAMRGIVQGIPRKTCVSIHLELIQGLHVVKPAIHAVGRKDRVPVDRYRIRGRVLAVQDIAVEIRRILVEQILRTGR